MTSTIELDDICRAIDSNIELRDESKLRECISTLESVDRGQLDDEQKGVIEYCFGNVYASIWEIRVNQDPDLNWSWSQEESERSVFHFRASLLNLPDTDSGNFRKYQALTNLGNALNTFGRFVEAQRYWVLAHDYLVSTRTTRKASGMALVNRGIGLIYYGFALYDPGHTMEMHRQAYQLLVLGAQLGVEPGVPELVDKWKAKLEGHYKAAFLNTKPTDESYPIGSSKAERGYRQWCLSEKLFLNPLNDIDDHSRGARDILHLPPIVTDLDAGPGFHGLFNQLKQEFIAARTFYYDGTHPTNKKHFSDNDMFLYDTLDYPRYGHAIELQRQAFRMAYSILDKVAYFVNEYFKAGHEQRRVYFNRVWFAPKDRERKQVLPVIAESKNWPLRGLYFLSKDIWTSDVDFREVLEPAAQGLDDLRNSLEHRYLKLHEMYRPPTEEEMRYLRSTLDDLAQSLQLDDFQQKTVHMLRVARAALIYLSLSIHQYEKQKKRDNNRPTASIALRGWEPDIS